MPGPYAAAFLIKGSYGELTPHPAPQGRMRATLRILLINGWLRLSRNSCRGEHCSPAPVCFVRQLSRKKRCCGKLTGDQWSPLHTQ